MEVVQNNFANVDTPGYKKKDVSFEEVFDKRLLVVLRTKTLKVYNEIMRLSL